MKKYPAKVMIRANSPDQAMKATDALNFLSAQFDAKGIVNIVKKFKNSPTTQLAVKAAANGF